MRPPIPQSGAKGSGHDDVRLSAEAVRQIVDERGGSLKASVRNLLKVFDRKKLASPEEADEIQAALTEQGLSTNPPLREVRRRIYRSSTVIIERREPATGADSKEGEPTFEVNRAGVALALAGAALMVIAVFLPRVESGTFIRVQDNTLIESGDGWGFIVLAVIALAGVYRVTQQQRKSWAPIVVGVIAVGLAIYDGTGDRLELQGGNLLGNQVSETASAGVGIYAAGAGGLLTALGGAWLAGMTVGAGGQAVPMRRTKKCPDCAETVLADARVCKHCGFRFETGEATEQATTQSRP